MDSQQNECPVSTESLLDDVSTTVSPPATPSRASTSSPRRSASAPRLRVAQRKNTPLRQRSGDFRRSIVDVSVDIGLGALAAQNHNLTTLEGMSVFPDLKCLYVQNNRLKSLYHLKIQPKLKELHAHHNDIKSFYGLQNQPQLELICMHDNPIANHPTYRLMCILAVGLQLNKIDNQGVQYEEKELVRRMDKRIAEAVRLGWLLDLRKRTAEEYEAMIEMLRSEITDPDTADFNDINRRIAEKFPGMPMEVRPASPARSDTSTSSSTGRSSFLYANRSHHSDLVAQPMLNKSPSRRRSSTVATPTMSKVSAESQSALASADQRRKSASMNGSARSRTPTRPSQPPKKTLRSRDSSPAKAITAAKAIAAAANPRKATTTTKTASATTTTSAPAPAPAESTTATTATTKAAAITSTSKAVATSTTTATTNAAAETTTLAAAGAAAAAEMKTTTTDAAKPTTSKQVKSSDSKRPTDSEPPVNDEMSRRNSSRSESPQTAHYPLAPISQAAVASAESNNDLLLTCTDALFFDCFEMSGFETVVRRTEQNSAALPNQSENQTAITEQQQQQQPRPQQSRVVILSTKSARLRIQRHSLQIVTSATFDIPFSSITRTALHRDERRRFRLRLNLTDDSLVDIFCGDNRKSTTLYKLLHKFIISYQTQGAAVSSVEHQQQEDQEAQELSLTKK